MREEKGVKEGGEGVSKRGRDKLRMAEEERVERKRLIEGEKRGNMRGRK